MLRRAVPRLCAGKIESSSPALQYAFHEGSGVHHLTMSREKALNALNQEMVDAAVPLYRHVHAEGSKAGCVLLKGTGPKAFCAGGDVVGIVKDTPAGTRKRFFYTEYQMNHLILTLQVPHVALWDGIVMGGGFGISGHGSHRVVSEKGLFAMPETGIGLFPDVGGTWFLPRLPHAGLGMYLALTGQRLKGEDIVHAGVGTHFVPSAKMADLEAALVGTAGLAKAADKAAKAAAVNDVIGQVAGPREVTPFSLAPHMAQIAAIFGPNAASVEDILAALKADGSAWALKQRDHMATLSPSSMKVSFALQRRGAALTDPADMFRLEYRVTQRMMETNDFTAGVTALLIEKSGKPTWSPATLEDVTAAVIESHFAPCSHGIEWDPIKAFPE